MTHARKNATGKAGMAKTQGMERGRSTRALPIMADRMARWLAGIGVRSSRSQVVCGLAAVLGLRNDNELAALAASGALSPPVAERMGTVDVGAGGRTIRLVVMMDPQTGAAFGVDERCLAEQGRVSRYLVSPYGSLIEVAKAIAGDGGQTAAAGATTTPGGLADGNRLEDPTQQMGGVTLHIAEVTSGSRRVDLLVDEDLAMLEAKVCDVILSVSREIRDRWDDHMNVPRRVISEWNEMDEGRNAVTFRTNQLDGFVPAALPVGTPIEVQVTEVSHRHGREVILTTDAHATERRLAAYCRENWDVEDVEERGDAEDGEDAMTDAEVVETYFERTPGESYETRTQSLVTTG